MGCSILLWVYGMDVHHEISSAKLNLSLKIVGRRPDGFHMLESLMTAIDWQDHLSFQRVPGSSIRLSVPGYPKLETEENLVVRAVRRFFETANIPQDEQGLVIELTKTIPTGSGMGGGSSNAAATLRALQRLYKVSLDAKGLIQLACGLGADVPFFLDSMPRMVRGIGDSLGDPASLPELTFVVSEVPSFLSTKEVYEAFDHLCKPSRESAGTIPTRWSYEALSQCLENDLEPAAFRQNPSLGDLKRMMQSEEALGTSMTGSGPSFFTVFEDVEKAQSFIQELEHRLPVRLCRPVFGISEVVP